MFLSSVFKAICLAEGSAFCRPLVPMFQFLHHLINSSIIAYYSGFLTGRWSVYWKNYGLQAKFEALDHAATFYYDQKILI